MTIAFTLSFEEVVVKRPEADEEKNLKIIKRRPMRDTAGAAAEVYADEVSFSYYNGTGWRKLPLKASAESLFAAGKTGEITLRFVCPADWQETEAGSYEGRCIRLQLLRADNCYYQPAVHHCPVIRHMRISYDYDGRFVRPQKLVSFREAGNGISRRDLRERRRRRFFLGAASTRRRSIWGLTKRWRTAP